MEYTLQKQVSGEFDEVIEQTITALGEEGFGVLADIDFQATFAEKLDEEFRQYRVLGACNPPLANEALEEDIDLGALLPCNVVVYETDEGEVVVSAVDPEQLLSLAENPALDSIGEDVSNRLERVLDAL
jgi:uncharacterized protein (DUF302 family)